jgi:ATP-binding cassette subfamily C protein LapB
VFNINASFSISVLGALVGGAGSDSFNVAAGAVLSGNIQGGNDSDTLTLVDGNTSFVLGAFDGGKVVADGPRDRIMEALSSGRIAKAA